MANSFVDVLMKRRSVRDFKEGDIPPEHLKKILQAGIMAPSPNNSQPWRFHVIKEKSKDKFIEVLRNTNTIPAVWQQPIFSGIGTVPIVIAVENPVFRLKDEDVPAEGTAACTSGKNKNVTAYGSLLGTAACVENMLLAAHSMGYGSVWIGFPGVLEAAKQLVGTSGHIVAVLPIGYPAEVQRDYFDRTRKSVEDVARFYD